MACADAVRQRGAQGALRLHLGALLVQLHVERADLGAWGVYTWQENQEEVQAQRGSYGSYHPGAYGGPTLPTTAG